MEAPSLLELPAEIRNKIWKLAFANIDTTPYRKSPRVLRYHACETCRDTVGGPDSFMTSREAHQPLLACKQIYDEASAILKETIRHNISLCDDLEKVRHSSLVLRKGVHHLNLCVHPDEETRDYWMIQLIRLHEALPLLQTLTVQAHMRPPIAYENLVDAVFLCGPLARLPSSIKQTLTMKYTEDGVMFRREEFGTVHYHDALEEHGMVVRDLLADASFRQLAKGPDLDLMTARLLMISREHEQPWIASLRRKRLAEIAAEEGQAQEKAKEKGEEA